MDFHFILASSPISFAKTTYIDKEIIWLALTDTHTHTTNAQHHVTFLSFLPFVHNKLHIIKTQKYNTQT